MYNLTNNQVAIEGEVSSPLTPAFKFNEEKFYSFKLRVPRLSGTDDYIPVVVSERIIDVNYDWMGEYVKIEGQFRSFNDHKSPKHRLVLNVFVKEMWRDEPSTEGDTNKIVLDGYLCKEPVYRKTPLGREIADMLVAVNRAYGKSDYIPCICWGRNARYASGFFYKAKLLYISRNGCLSNIVPFLTKALDQGFLCVNFISFYKL